MTDNNKGLPSLTPDRDKVEAFKNTRIGSEHPAKPDNFRPNRQGSKPAKQPSSSGNSFIIILLFIIIGASGWWFYQQDMLSKAAIEASKQRIQSLENQLSATGEEMGESAIAMKVKLENLSKRTEDLWVQMDKLWASAWRRNQTEIIELRKKIKGYESYKNKLATQSKSISSNASTLKSIEQKQTEADFSLSMLTEQLQSANNQSSELANLKNTLSSLEAKSINQDKTQIELASTINKLNSTQQALLDRISQLENERPIVEIKDNPSFD